MSFAARPVLDTGGGGGGGGSVSISDQTISGSAFFATAFALYELLATGDWQASTSNGGIVGSGSWLTPPTGVSGYDARASIVSGPTGGGVATGTYGVWLNLASTRSWGVETTSGTTSLVITVEIRPAGGGAVLDSATITLNATSS